MEGSIISTRERIAQCTNKRYDMALTRMRSILNKREEKQLKEFYIEKMHTTAFLRQLHCTTGNLKDYDGKARLRSVAAAAQCSHSNSSTKLQHIRNGEKTVPTAWEEKSRGTNEADERTSEREIVPSEKWAEIREESKEKADESVTTRQEYLDIISDFDSISQDGSESNYSVSSDNQNGPRIPRVRADKRYRHANSNSLGVRSLRRASFSSHSSSLANDLNSKVRVHKKLNDRSTRKPSLSFLSNCRNLDRFNLNSERKTSNAGSLGSFNFSPVKQPAGIPQRASLPRLVITGERRKYDNSAFGREGSVHSDEGLDRQFGTGSVCEEESGELRMDRLAAYLPNIKRKYSV